MADLIANTSAFLNDLDYSNLPSNEQAQVDALIDVATEYIEKYCNRIFLQATYTDEIQDGTGEKSIFVANPPIQSLTDIDIIVQSESGDTTSTFLATKFDYESKTGEIRFKPDTFLNTAGGVFSKGFQNIKITYSGGWVAVPQSIQLIAAEFVKERFDPTLVEDTLEREKLGDYFYAKSKDFWKRLLATNRFILNSYKIRKV